MVALIYLVAAVAVLGEVGVAVFEGVGLATTHHPLPILITKINVLLQKQWRQLAALSRIESGTGLAEHLVFLFLFSDILRIDLLYVLLIGVKLGRRYL